MKFLFSWLALVAAVIVLTACGDKATEVRAPGDPVDVMTIRQELSDAKDGLEKQRVALERLREVVDERILTMESSIDTLTNSLDEVDRHLPSLAEDTRAPDSAKKAEKTEKVEEEKKGLGWPIAIILLLIIVIVIAFALKARGAEDEDDLWPDDGEDVDTYGAVEPCGEEKGAPGEEAPAEETGEEAPGEEEKPKPKKRARKKAAKDDNDE